MLITLIRLLHIWPQIQSNLSAHLDQTIPHSVFQFFILFFCILMLDVDSHDRPPAIPCRRECTKAPPAAEIFASIYSELHPLPAPSSRHRPLPHPRPHPTIRRKCFVTGFLVKCAQPGIIGGKDTSSISREPAICLGELSRCLISFIISRLERAEPTAIPAMSDSTPSTDGSV